MCYHLQTDVQNSNSLTSCFTIFEYLRVKWKGVLLPLISKILSSSNIICLVTKYPVSTLGSFKYFMILEVGLHVLRSFFHFITLTLSCFQCREKKQNIADTANLFFCWAFYPFWPVVYIGVFKLFLFCSYNPDV